MADRFSSQEAGLTAPANKAYSVTPDDDQDLSYVTRGLYVGGAGNLSLILMSDSSPVTFTGVLAGSVLPLRVKRVRATGTTATNLVALH